MDRLYALTLLVALTGACDSEKPAAEKPADEPAAKSRVNAVQAKALEAESAEDFCDVYKEPAEAPTFAYPALEGEAPAPAKGWTWVNVWATWCVPCIEEMPRLAAWEKELSADGLGDVVFINADNTAEIVTKFREKHPDLPGTDGPRIAQMSTLTDWVAGMGLSGAALPVHIFVDGEQRVRCLRAGGVSEADEATIQQLLGS